MNAVKAYGLPFLAVNIHFSKLEGRRKWNSGKHDYNQSSAWVAAAGTRQTLCGPAAYL